MLSHQIHLGPTSAYMKEIAKHEGLPGLHGMPGRPYQFRDYPTAMYKPTRDVKTGEVSYELSTADDDIHRERLERSGFVHGGKGAALAALEKREFEFAELAAARVPGEMRMGEKAREEAEQVDNTTIQHLPVIPEARDRSEHMPKARRTS
jgi:hypothetical protein